MTLLELTIHCQVNHLHPGVFLGLKMIFPQACSQSPWWPILLKQLHMCIRAQSCLTLCTLMDCNLLGSSVQGILQASGFRFPSPRDLPNPGIETAYPVSPCIGRQIFFTTELPGKPAKAITNTNMAHILGKKIDHKQQITMQDAEFFDSVLWVQRKYTRC